MAGVIACDRPTVTCLGRVDLGADRESRPPAETPGVEASPSSSWLMDER